MKTLKPIFIFLIFSGITFADAANAGRERAGAEVLLEFSGIRIFSETFVPLNSNARTSSNDKNKPKAGTVLQLNTAYKDDYVKVYPNPTNGKFFVEYTINAMETGSFVLTDISGKEMWRRTLTKNKGKLTLDQNTPPGMYLYQIIVNGEVFTIDKLIITQ
ncbi:MAG: T9SS type A sorting domain-containing protein [Vicingaceae bacterium]|nr:T9SS type A sorting domain-containing protein [Vicingaceae bacterium]